MSFERHIRLVHSSTAPTLVLMNSKSALAEQHATYKAECACPGPQDPHRRRKSSGVASEHPQAEDKAGPLSWCRATSLNKAVRRLTTEMNAVISVVVAVVVVVVMAGPVCSGPLQRVRLDCILDQIKHCEQCRVFSFAICKLHQQYIVLRVGSNIMIHFLYILLFLICLLYTSPSPRD